jgi:pimeloyl-ACP methyl ester carboxylesterase
VTVPTARAVDVHFLLDHEGAGGVPIVLVHGVGDSTASWERVIDGLPPNRVVVRYDLRGHGRSPSPPGPWTIDDFVADHLLLMQRLGIRTADVVGFSLGGLIAQRLAATAPEAVRRLVVVGAVAGRTEAEAAAVRERLQMVEAEGPLGAAVKSVDRGYSAEHLRAHPEVREQTIERMRALDPDGYTHAYRVLATTDLADGETSNALVSLVPLLGNLKIAVEKVEH